MGFGIDLQKAVEDKATDIKRDLEPKLEEIKVPQGSMAH